MPYVRPVRVDELTKWLIANGVDEAHGIDAASLAQKMYDYFEEILILSSTAQ